MAGVLQRRNLTVAGARVPNWQFDTICLEQSLTEKAADLFRLELLPVEWPDTAPGPEWFGDGWKAFREVLVRRELAELLVAESPRDFKIHEVPGAP